MYVLSGSITVHLDEQSYENADIRADMVLDEISDVLKKHGVPYSVSNVRLEED